MSHVLQDEHCKAAGDSGKIGRLPQLVSQQSILRQRVSPRHPASSHQAHVKIILGLILILLLWQRLDHGK